MNESANTSFWHQFAKTFDISLFQFTSWFSLLFWSHENYDKHKACWSFLSHWTWASIPEVTSVRSQLQAMCSYFLTLTLSLIYELKVTDISLNGLHCALCSNWLLVELLFLLSSTYLGYHKYAFSAWIHNASCLQSAICLVVEVL